MKKVNPLNLILAIFLPPIGALLQVGFSAHFFINILLTILGVLPGILHAVWLVLTDKKG
ncbi:YqaE/Pmp3 family membrane protein [Aliiglaciecola sp. CAU 1673]|uniref:YqaE/Pmp3 family membrane protein n=1 Tax=Aliiglaciecola sp. CAU 1673 TaxID=3032595 RepID=UPI0023D9D3C9|nr:YqaE/Pmp3 family membrane protein [Aliiglaciecola sp. CAU 1673]MDF2176790.1 YqaE/Pmp3 family membrane protein [Aliiglaciecola sp. CAU 1673]